MTRRYGPRAQEKVEEAMRELKRGRLRSGSGARVVRPQQAVAIGLAQARKAGARVPPQPGKPKARAPGKGRS